MVGQAPSSLVSGDRKVRRATLWWLVVLNIGFLLGSGAVMATAWGLGTLVGTSGMDVRVRLGILLAAVAVFLFFDVPAALRGGSSRLGLRRQTPKVFQYGHRADTTALFWGADIGTGVSTYRMTSAVWLGIVAVFLGVVPFFVGWMYGVGVVLSISALITFIGGGYGLHANLPRLFAARRPVQLSYVAAVGLVAVASLAAMAGA